MYFEFEGLDVYQAALSSFRWLTRSFISYLKATLIKRTNCSGQPIL